MLTVIVVGGSLAGLSTAIALARTGHRVTVLEAREEFTELGAGIQMPPNSTRIMRDWGLLDRIQARATVPEAMVLRSYRDGQVLHSHQLGHKMEETFGSPYFLIHRKEILQILVTYARQLRVHLKVNSPVTNIDFSEPSVTTAGGETLTADLIVGADGEHSFCRGAILNQRIRPQPTGKLVYRLTVDPDVVRQDPALRHLVSSPSCITGWIGPRSHVVVYEIPFSGILNVAITCPDPVQDRVQYGPRDAGLEELESHFSGWDPLLLRLLRLATRASFWTLLQLPGENRTWVDGTRQRTVLVGDAAHAMTPYLAQGAAQAIEDGAFLGLLFSRVDAPEEIPSRLARFCERRGKRSLAVRAMAWEAGRTLEMEDGPGQVERDRRMREDEVRAGFPNAHADPDIQRFVFRYSVEEDVGSL